jgi:hypothetical protein
MSGDFGAACVVLVPALVDAAECALLGWDELVDDPEPVQASRLSTHRTRALPGIGRIVVVIAPPKELVGDA